MLMGVGSTGVIVLYGVNSFANVVANCKFSLPGTRIRNSSCVDWARSVGPWFRCRS